MLVLQNDYIYIYEYKIQIFYSLALSNITLVKSLFFSDFQLSSHNYKKVNTEEKPRIKIWLTHK